MADFLEHRLVEVVVVAVTLQGGTESRLRWKSHKVRNASQLCVKLFPSYMLNYF